MLGYYFQKLNFEHSKFLKKNQKLYYNNAHEKTNK